MRSLFLAVALTLSTITLHGQGDEPIEERLRVAGLKVEETRRFFNSLQANVRQGNRTAVCRMFRYPFDVGRSKKGGNAADPADIVTIRTPTACVRDYAVIFTAEIRRLIATATFQGLFANYQGVMILGPSSEDLWFSGICRQDDCKTYDIKIVTVSQNR